MIKVWADSPKFITRQKLANQAVKKGWFTGLDILKKEQFNRKDFDQKYPLKILVNENWNITEPITTTSMLRQERDEAIY